MTKYTDLQAYWYVKFSTRYGFKGISGKPYKVACISSIAADRLSVCGIGEFGYARNEHTKEHVNYIMSQRIEHLEKFYDASRIEVRQHFGWIVSVSLKTEKKVKI